MNEFSLIDQYFKAIPITRDDVVYGIGDDAACVNISNGKELLVSTDTLVSGVHFLPHWDPYDIAYKTVMVNVSDMAAMAAEPCWATLALTLEETDPVWLKAFAQGLSDALKQFNIDLIGGDTSHGPLTITLTILGTCPKGESIRRSGAKAGDIIFVSGEIGAAALAVNILENKKIAVEDKKTLMKKLLHPKPRIDLIYLLRQYATAAIDISDGLSADLNHICESSGVGACLIQKDIPLHPLLAKYTNEEKAVDIALCGGDDYEICFTVSAKQVPSFMIELKKMDLKCYQIGLIEQEEGLRLRTINEKCKVLTPRGYLHF